MGSTYKVQCENCKKDYGEIREGGVGGLSRFPLKSEIYFFPCVDIKNCNVTYENYFNKEIQKDTNIIFYDDDSIFILADGEEPADKSNKYYIPKIRPGDYYCPNCQSFSLLFNFPGIWD